FTSRITKVSSKVSEQNALSRLPRPPHRLMRTSVKRMAHLRGGAPKHKGLRFKNVQDVPRVVSPDRQTWSDAADVPHTQKAHSRDAMRPVVVSADPAITSLKEHYSDKQF